MGKDILQTVFQLAGSKIPFFNSYPLALLALWDRHYAVSNKQCNWCFFSVERISYIIPRTANVVFYFVVVVVVISGKTYFTMRLIRNASAMFEHPPKKIIYAFGVYQDGFRLLEKHVPNIILHEGLPTEDYVDQELDTKAHNLLILDDLLAEVAGSKEYLRFFTIRMHHLRISLLLICQNLYFNAPNFRTISLNLSYFVLMKTFRDRQQIMCLARQMFPNDARRMMEAYEDSVREPRGYLVVSSVPTVEDEDRLVTSIFPGELLTVYVKKT